MDWTPIRTAITWLGITLCLAVAAVAGLSAYVQAREISFGLAISVGPPAQPLTTAIGAIVVHPWPVLALALVGAVLLWRARPE